MKHEFSPIARRRLNQIWQYTEAQWGQPQADRYIRAITAGLDHIAENRALWLALDHPHIRDVYYTRIEHHYVFFITANAEGLRILTVLHESMDLPNRLREDLTSEKKQPDPPNLDE